ncbi:MAG: MogA/MoaB family molybdenum cofactor biosynthesis protein [Desulfuromonadales bacterium]|nr:MogA/MoaB family molybdenum cofactor biosynthesis protein [Desulfuromonadales bacterium]
MRPHDHASFRIGILTLSDKGAVGERVDQSGQVIRQMVTGLGTVESYQILADEFELIRTTLRDWADQLDLHLILTTGGTGLSPRDVTPQATAAVLDYQVPGLAEAMRLASLQQTPHAMLSRAIAGVRGRCLIVNLPGSPKAVRENLAVLLPALPHALAKLAGDPDDCAR